MADASPVRAVSLDAAGTLFHPVRPIGALYAEVAGRHGVRVAPADVGAAFRRAFRDAPPLAFPGAPAAELRTLERAWWRGVVRTVFAGVAFPDFEAYFDDLFAFFASPAAWRIDPDAPAVLAWLHARGVEALVVSNFDARVRGVLAALGLADGLTRVVISSEAGAAKPDPAIFAHALAAGGLAPSEVVHVGDTVREDLAGARAAGIGCVLVGGPELAGEAAGAPVLPRLGMLPDWLDATRTA